MALQRLKEAAEKAKKELSQVTQRRRSRLPFITMVNGQPKHLNADADPRHLRRDHQGS